MKKLLIIVVLFLLCSATYAQENIKTGNFTIETVEYGTYINDNWVMDGPPAKYEALFKVTETMVKQVGEANAWTYYVEKGPEWNDQHNHWVLYIVDKEGDDYLMIIDFNNSNLRFIYNDGDGNMRITRFAYSNVFGKA